MMTVHVSQVRINVLETSQVYGERTDIVDEDLGGARWRNPACFA